MARRPFLTNDIFNPVLSLLPVLLLREKKRLENLPALADGCECLVVVNPAVPLKTPRISPVVRPDLTIGELVEMCEEAFPHSPHLSHSVVVVDRLTHLLYTLGLFHVDRSRIIKSARRNGKPRLELMELLDDFLSHQKGGRRGEMVFHNVTYLAEALADKAAISQRGLPVDREITGEVYLCFFDKEQVVRRRGSLSYYKAPQDGAYPKEVLRLMTPGFGEWFYYRESYVERYDPSQELWFSELSPEESSVIIDQLSSKGVAAAEALGVRVSSFREEMKRVLTRYRNSCNSLRRRNSGRFARIEKN